MAVNKLVSDLGGYVGAPLLYAFIWFQYGMPMDTARATALTLYELHFGDDHQYISKSFAKCHMREIKPT